MKTGIKKVTKLAVLTALCGIANSTILPASDVAAATTVKAPYSTAKKWTTKLAKAGYVFELPNAVKGALYHQSGKPYRQKTLKKIVKNQTLFKVKRVNKIHNGVSVDLVSKNGKYKGNTVYINGILNHNSKIKELQPLIKAELRVMEARGDQRPTAELLKQVEQIATGLTGKNKQLALTSIKQLKEFIKYGTMAETPDLLIGSWPNDDVDN
ncbi:hypothetical protein [Lactobacillus sp.]|uniref:hypothetical protein n=1 Tax=Lactobacillus sp. TaxID=1591 RepID=UPI0025D7AB35|nr:hypothetical protein [Lactobacillus sp.]MCO6534603.1 hypothetical protein [Lactobacillus sp.]